MFIPGKQTPILTNGACLKFLKKSIG